MKKLFASVLAISILAANPVFAQSNDETMQSEAEKNAATYKAEEIKDIAAEFFGKTSENVGKAVEKIFADKGEPVGYIAGNEFAGAIGFGLRYGEGQLVMKDGETRKVYWQGPSIGFDTGANASKVFTLVYNLGNPDGIYRRYPGVEGAAYLVAGIGVTYQQAEGVVLAPMRTGVGLRAGANAGYTAISKTRKIWPF